MKKAVFFLAVLLLGINTAFAVDFPQATGFVNDFENLLTQEQKTQLEGTLKTFKDQTSNEIAVVTVPSFQGLDSFTYAQQLATKWGIGSADRNNGILFLISVGEKQMRIHVGKGLEGALPDSLSGSIMDAEVVPSFKKSEYAKGIIAGVNAIIQATKGEYTAKPSETSSNLDISSLWVLFCIGFFLINYIGSFLARSKSWWLGGVLGGAGGLIVGFIFLSGILILLPIVGLGASGLIFDYVVSKNYEERKKKGLPTDFWRSGGGFWFGGGRGGGGIGGGFGGFGGGGFGGGGAGRSW